MITHAFTYTGPYAILIMPDIKRVENRTSVFLGYHREYFYGGRGGCNE